jgi:hypothetical protein
VEISDAEFGNRLEEMQVWLDVNRFAPSTLTYFFLLPRMRLRIAFDIDDEAAAFATRLDGILVDAADRCRPDAERRGVAETSALRSLEPAPQ